MKRGREYEAKLVAQARFSMKRSDRHYVLFNLHFGYEECDHPFDKIKRVKEADKPRRRDPKFIVYACGNCQRTGWVIG